MPRVPGTVPRREFLLTGVAAFTLRQSANEMLPPHRDDVPDAKTLAAGDFLWPKLPGDVVPFTSEPGAATERHRDQWEADRRSHLNELLQAAALTEQEKQRFSLLSSPLTYQEFLLLYLNDENPREPVPLASIIPFAVGHVAIADIVGGRVMVTEAMYGTGVRTIEYSEWVRTRPGELVWHARLGGISLEDGRNMAAFARKQIGKPYGFWNFNLRDDTSFYCSKLCWFVTWSALSIALDDNPTGARALWYSPKRMLRSRYLILLNNPWRYTFR